MEELGIYEDGQNMSANISERAKVGDHFNPLHPMMFNPLSYF